MPIIPTIRLHRACQVLQRALKVRAVCTGYIGACGALVGKIIHLAPTSVEVECVELLRDKSHGATSMHETGGDRRSVYRPVVTIGCAEIAQRDKRFYYRALWNFSLGAHLKELDVQFNGVDFGHSNPYENLLLTGARGVPAVKKKARKETLRFIASRPCLNPNEEAITPTYTRLAWKAQNTFDEAHALHR